MIRSIVILFISVVFTKVLSLPAETKQEELKKNPEEADAEGGTDKKPKDFFRIQEEAKVLLERDPKLKPQFVAIIHNKFPHPTFLGERVPWYQVYVYSDYFLGLPMEERKKYTKLVIAEKLFESGFHRVSFNCLTMEDEKFSYTPPEDEVGGISTPRSAESEYEGPMMKRYRKVIEDNFKIHHLEILDTSDNYHLPANSEKFLTILLVTDEFIGKSEYQREEMVIAKLKKDMPWDTRGLALINMTPDEYKKQDKGGTTPETVYFPHSDSYIHLLKNSTHYLCQPPFLNL